MFGALITYPLIFLTGYLLLSLLNRRQLHLSETLILSFLLGTANIIFILFLFGTTSKLSIGIYAWLVELVGLTLILVKRFKGRLKQLLLKPPPFHLNFINPAFIPILIGLGYLFLLLWSSLPPKAWDALTFYLPWAKQFLQYDKIPNFDYDFNAGYPIPFAISFCLLAYLLYFWSGGVNEMLAYTISPIYALMTMLTL
jgi:hypothetical protein